MEVEAARKSLSEIHLSGHSELSEAEQEHYNELILRAKRLVGEGRIEDALRVNKKALSICYSQKLAKKIKKIEEYLKAHADESSEEEDTGQVHMGHGFYIYRDLYNSLYSHQQEGVLWLWDLFRRKKGGILGDDMGLGKTIQVIGFLSGMFDMQKIKSVLIVLPVAVMVNWEKEFEKWAPGIKVLAYHGSKKEKERALTRIQRRGGVLLTTFGLVVTSWEQLGNQDGREFVWDYVILDEGHKIKNPTKTSKGVHAIPARNRIILTGTPVQNNLKELWSLFDFVHQGTLLGTQKTFKMQYETPIITAREKDCTTKEKILGMEMAESLKNIIAPYFLRRTKAEVKQREVAEQKEQGPTTTHAVMPTMTRKNDLIVWTFLRDAQLQIYKDFLSLDHVKELLMAKRSPLVALLVLKKICDHPRLLSTRACSQLGIEDEHLDEDILETEEGSQSAVTRIQHVADEVLINESGKLLFLVKLLDRLKEEGHRCLVFSQSRKMLDIMEKVISNRGHKIMRLDGTIRHVQEREQRIQQFQTDEQYSVFLLTTQVGGVGLTLTAADRVVIFDPSWNPATDNQAVDRVFRIGQDKNVVIYRLITCGTVEEKIYRRQVFKDSITRQTTGNAKNPYRYFSKQELRELFVLDDPHSSTTQQQLERMHSGQRLTDPSLDEHIAYLYSLDMYGLSDHDLMFSQDSEGQDDEEVLNEEESDEYIKHTVQKAREIIQMESSQVVPLEERHGIARPAQQSAATGERPKNQFNTWDFPKPGLSQQETEEGNEESGTDEDTEDYSDTDLKPNVIGSPAESIDLTSPQKVKKEKVGMDEVSVKQEPGESGRIKQELDTQPAVISEESVRVKQELHVGPQRPAGTVKQEPVNPQELVAPMVHDLTTDTPKSAMKSKLPDADEEPMDLGTPKCETLKQPNSLSHVKVTPSSERRSVSKATSHDMSTPTRDCSIVHEEIMISPDASKPLLQVQRPMNSLSSSSLQDVSAFQPKFSSTKLFSANESPDIMNQSVHSGHDRASDTGSGSSMQSPRRPFRVVVDESPASDAGSHRSRAMSGVSSGTDRDVNDLSDEEADVNEPLEIDESVVISDGEEKENIEPVNVSVRDIQHILQKSLLNKTGESVHQSFSESPVVSKSRRRSVACRRVIESSDEENDEIEKENEEETENNSSEETEEPENTGNSEDMENEFSENDVKVNDSAEAVSDTENLGGGDNRKDLQTSLKIEGNGECNFEPVHERSEDIGDKNIRDQSRDDEKYTSEQEEEGAEENEEDDEDVEEEEVEEEEEMSDEGSEEMGFDALSEAEQIRYNELVEAGRIYCQNKQYEEGQACVLQALEIFPDEELQQTALALQKKIQRRQMRAQTQQMDS